MHSLFITRFAKRAVLTAGWIAHVAIELIAAGIEILAQLTTLAHSVSFRFVKMPQRIGTLTRSIAGSVLLLWVAALVTCWFHCASGACAPGPLVQKAHASCHGGSSTGDSKKSESGTRCLMQEKASSPDLSVGLPVVAVTLLYVIPRLSEFSDFQQEAAQDSQDRSPDWMLNPEVYLGPAFRTNAPPSHLLA